MELLTNPVIKTCYQGLQKAMGFSGGQCRTDNRLGFDLWVGKIRWRKAWQPTLVFLPGESPVQRRLAGYCPQGCKELDMTEAT